MSLPQFIEITIQAEQAIEQKRQELATLEMFEPYTVYKRLDQPRLGGLKQAQFVDFLTDNKIDPNNLQINFLFQYIDSDKDGVITYEDLKNIILPRQNQALLDQCMNRQQYEIPVDMLLPNNLEKCLTEFFQLIIQYFEQIQQISVNDINLNQVNIYEEDESITVNSLSAWFQSLNIAIDEDGLQTFIGLIDQQGTGRGTQQGLQTVIDQFAAFQQKDEGNQVEEDQQQNQQEQEYAQEYQQEQENVKVDQSEKPQYSQKQQQQQQQQKSDNGNQKSQINNQKNEQQQEQYQNRNGNAQKQQNVYQNDRREFADSQQTYPLHKSYITPDFNNFRSPLLDYFDEQIRIEKEKIWKLESSLGISSDYSRFQYQNIRCDFYQRLIDLELDKISRLTIGYNVSPTRMRQRFSYHYDLDLTYTQKLRQIEIEIQIEQERLRSLSDFYGVSSRLVQSKISQLNLYAKPNKQIYENINFESPLKQEQSMQYSYAQKSTPEKQLDGQGRSNHFDAQKKQQLYNQGMHQNKQ